MLTPWHQFCKVLKESFPDFHFHAYQGQLRFSPVCLQGGLEAMAQRTERRSPPLPFRPSLDILAWALKNAQPP